MAKKPASLHQESASNKTLVIAEKPSVAADIAKALGGFTKHEDFYEN